MLYCYFNRITFLYSELVPHSAQIFGKSLFLTFEEMIEIWQRAEKE